MGRLSIIDQSVEKLLYKDLGKPATTAAASTTTGSPSYSSCGVGLLLGCATESRDYIVHLAKTPIDEAENIKSIADISDALVTSHAGELQRMLAGGLCVCGIAAVGTDLPSHLTKLQQLMTATYKKVCKSDVYGEQTDCWQLLMVDQQTNRISSKSLLVNDYKSSLKPSEVRFQSLAGGWLIAETQLAVDRNFYLCRQQQNQHFEQQLMGGLSTYLETISKSLCLCDGQLANEEQTFGVADTSKGKKNSQQSLAPSRVDVQLLSKVQEAGNDSSSSCNEMVSSLHLRGTVSAIAYLRAPATAAHICKAIKQDLQKTLSIRCQLLCEDILQVGSEQHTLEGQLTYEMPPRVHIAHSTLPLTFDDYMFKDEKVEDCAERAQQLLGIEAIDSSTIDTGVERAATLRDIEELRQKSTDESDVDNEVTSSRGSFISSVGGIVSIASGAVVALALSLGYLNMEEWFG